MQLLEFFLEHREALRVTHRRGRGELQLERQAGYGRSSLVGDDLAWQWSELSPEPAPAALPASLRQPADRLLGGGGALEAAGPRMLALCETLEQRAREAGAAGVELELRGVLQRVHLAGGGDTAADERSFAQLGVRARCEHEGRSHTSLGERAWPGVEALLADAAAIERLVVETVERARANLSQVACPQGTLTVVLPPGADSGVLFHEVCGHPMEGDVVARGASFLARRRGHQVGPEFLSVTDDPTARTGGVAYALDDEGTPARCAWMLRAGRVHEPLVNRRTAQALGVEPNGHGRRVGFRHPAVPRMSHTGVQPFRGRFEELVADVEEGLLVGFLSPRFVHLLSGEFCFDIPEARLIRNGRLAEYVRPGTLRGFALQALAGVDAVGEDTATFFGLKGCGKLDQPNLPVSFAMPTVRIQGLRVEPA